MTTAVLVRRALHDRVCMSDPCTDPDDHASRTQADAARAVLIAHRAGHSVARLLHDRECLLLLDASMVCADPAAHAWLWEQSARDLAGVLP